jgi:hypothetical protein
MNFRVRARAVHVLSADATAQSSGTMIVALACALTPKKLSTAKTLAFGTIKHVRASVLREKKCHHAGVVLEKFGIARPAAVFALKRSAAQEKH